MKRVARIGFGMAMGVILGAAGLNRFWPEGLEPVLAMAQDKAVAAPPTAVDLLREIVVAPDGGIAVTAAGAVREHEEVRAFDGSGQNGRGLMIFAPRVTLYDQRFVAGNDDALGLIGDTRGFLGLRMSFSGGVQSKSLIAYTHPTASNQPGPTYGVTDGYAGRFINCHFPGSARVNGGVYVFERCRFDVGPIGAVQVLGASRVNFIDCEFIAITNPYPDRPYFYPRLPADVAEREGREFDPCGVRVTGLSDGKQAATPIQARLYFAACRLRTFQAWEDYQSWQAGRTIRHEMISADGARLCRRFPTASDVKAGRNAYGLPGSVPMAVYLKAPN